MYINIADIDIYIIMSMKSSQSRAHFIDDIFSIKNITLIQIIQLNNIMILPGIDVD